MSNPRKELTAGHAEAGARSFHAQTGMSATSKGGVDGDRK